MQNHAEKLSTPPIGHQSHVMMHMTQMPGRFHSETSSNPFLIKIKIHAICYYLSHRNARAR